MKLAFLLSLAALALQAAAGAGFWWLSDAAYGPGRWLDESWELPLTYAGLCLAGPLALACASWATARWLSIRALAGSRIRVELVTQCIPSPVTRGVTPPEGPRRIST